MSTETDLSALCSFDGEFQEAANDVATLESCLRAVSNRLVKHRTSLARVKAAYRQEQEDLPDILGSALEHHGLSTVLDELARLCDNRLKGPARGCGTGALTESEAWLTCKAAVEVAAAIARGRNL